MDGSTERLLLQDLTSELPTKVIACHNLSVSSENRTFVERVLRNMRRKFGLPEQDRLDQIFTNEAIWGMFVNASLSEATCSLKRGFL